jgi:hypothetical protein
MEMSDGFQSLPAVLPEKETMVPTGLGDLADSQSPFLGPGEGKNLLPLSVIEPRPRWIARSAGSWVAIVPRVSLPCSLEGLIKDTKYTPTVSFAVIKREIIEQIKTFI